MTTTVALLGTCDTKLDEILFLRDQVRKILDTKTILIDVGRSNTNHDSIDISQQQLLDRHNAGQKVSGLSRAEVIARMTKCATEEVKELFVQGRIHGMIGAGGSCGTSLVCAVMRDAVSIGFPKLMVSTIASGDTGPLVGETDITLMYSVVDIAGLNLVLCSVLSNAAAAIAGMAHTYASRIGSQGNQGGTTNVKRVGITMFGVTTPAVNVIRDHLESKYGFETYIFHATGHGGKAMERLVREGQLDAVLDLTTTEVCDFLTGGVMSAGPNRLEAGAQAGIPNIISVGASDMTNFGPKNTVPERYRERKLYEHNPMVTLMRTSKEEARQVGEYIVKKLNEHTKIPDLVEIWLPRGGVSMISTPGGPYADEDSDAVMFQTIKDGLRLKGIKIIEDDRAINDESFACDIADALAQKLGREKF